MRTMPFTMDELKEEVETFTETVLDDVVERVS
jgi:hypothetical protein